MSTTSDILANITVVETDDNETAIVSQTAATNILFDGSVFNNVYHESAYEFILDTEKVFNIIEHSEPGPAGTSFTWSGEYSNSTTYAVNDVVSYNGSTYICNTLSTGNLPTDTNYWDLMVESPNYNAQLTIEDIIAGENISPYRVVIVSGSHVYLADKDTTSDKDKILGINGSSPVLTGNVANVHVSGKVSNGGWAWSPGAVYLNTAGTMIQTIPTSGFAVQIGKAISPTELYIDIDAVDYLTVDEVLDGGTF